MKQIYHFEQTAPPILSVKKLREELERRKVQRQIALLALASVLSLTVIVLLGLLMTEFYPIVAASCMLYVATTATESAVIAIVYTKITKIRRKY